jgi:hypothetical protein
MSYLNKAKHLKNMSLEEKASIIAQIRRRSYASPFLVLDKLMYFLRKKELNCVSLKQKENGDYHFWFNGRFIKINIRNGKIFIVDFDKNCLEYFCVDDFFQTAVQNKRYYLLYQLLNREKINKYKGKSVRSVSIFFTMSGASGEVVGNIEKAGQSSLKSPLGCLSIHEMVQGIERFIADRVSACFMRSSNLFRTALWANPMPSQTPSVDQFYGMGLFLNSKFNRRWFAMISLIMRKFLRNDVMTGSFIKQVAFNFLTRMIRSLSSMISNDFLENPIGFQRTDEMDHLLASSAKIILRSKSMNKCPPHSIADCVSDMIEIDKDRVGSLKKKREKWFNEERRREQEERRREQENHQREQEERRRDQETHQREQEEERRREQEEHQRKRAFQVFQEGLAGIEDDVSQARKGRCILNEFACGEGAMMTDETKTRKRGRKSDEFQDEDKYSFLKLE